MLFHCSPARAFTALMVSCARFTATVFCPAVLSDWSATPMSCETDTPTTENTAMAIRISKREKPFSPALGRSTSKWQILGSTFRVPCFTTFIAQVYYILRATQIFHLFPTWTWNVQVIE